MTNRPYQIQYYELLTDLLSNPDKEVKTRVGEARSKFSEKMKIDLRYEFPLMNIKQTSFKNIYVELLWFIKGDTNIKFLVDNGCNIWNDDAFRWYNEKYVKLGAPSVTKEEFIEKTKGEEIWLYRQPGDPSWPTVDLEKNYLYKYGDLDIVYGRQWRAFGGKVDQLADAIKTLRTNPDDRRIIITAHNPADIADGNVGLPSCHNYMQFYTQPIDLNKRVQIAKERGIMTPQLDELADKYVFYKFGKRKLEITSQVLGQINDLLTLTGVPQRYISVLVNIRSNDYFLGNPYNIASYALFLSMVAQCVGMIPLTLSCEMVDCHLYTEHIPAANEWIGRFEELIQKATGDETGYNRFMCNAKLKLNPLITSIDQFTVADCSVEDYESLGKIAALLLT